MTTRQIVLSLFIALVALYSARPSVADESNDCGLAIVLAMDVSPSVDGHDFMLQKEGLAAAISSAEIRDAIRSVEGGVALTVVLWSHEHYQRQVVPWMLLRSQSEMAAFARAVEDIPWPRMPEGTGTGLGAGLLHAAALLVNAPYQCRKQTIDVSGDGRNIVGPKPGPIRDNLVTLGITINGLAVTTHEENLVDYYRANLIGGAGAFVLKLSSYDDYAVGIYKKLLREILPRLANAR